MPSVPIDLAFKAPGLMRLILEKKKMSEPKFVIAMYGKRKCLIWLWNLVLKSKTSNASLHSAEVLMHRIINIEIPIACTSNGTLQEAYPN